MPFDASASWSGFNYQGKVALFHSLRLINSLDEDEISNYAVVLENNEDFEITKNDVPISFHQVKAYNNSSFSSYSNALIEMALELYKRTGVKSKIHTWKNINMKLDCDTIEESIKSEIHKIISDYEISSPREGNTVIERAASNASNVPKISAIIRQSLPEMSADEICSILKKIYDGENAAISRIEKYEYDDGCYCCSLEDINNKVKNEIKLWKQSRMEDVSDTQLTKAFHCFVGFIDDYIIDRHIAIGSLSKKAIRFDEIVCILNRDHDDTSYEHLAFKFKEIFFEIIEECMIDSEDEIYNLKESHKIMSKKTAIELFELYRKFSPHIDLQNSCHTRNAINICPDGIRYALMDILKTIDINQSRRQQDDSDFIYASRTDSQKSFIPTTIMKAIRLPLIEKRIIANPNLCDVFFEIENLIYAGDSVYTFSIDSASIATAPHNDEDDERDKRSDCLRNHNLVPIIIAKGEINS